MQGTVDSGCVLVLPHHLEAQPWVPSIADLEAADAEMRRRLSEAAGTSFYGNPHLSAQARATAAQRRVRLRA